MKSTLKSSFSRTPSLKMPHTTFNRTSGHKTTFDAGYLVPFFIDEALPGDNYNLETSVFARLSTFLRPIMDNLFLEYWTFFVPMRLVWKNWVKFQGEQSNPGDSIDFTIPKMTSPSTTGYDDLSLSDYFGIPTKVPDLPHSSLFHRTYNLIYNEFFRNENVQDSVFFDNGDADDDPANYKLLRRCKRYDYFTSALPWPQKGSPVSLPLEGNAPVGPIDLTTLGSNPTVVYSAPKFVSSNPGIEKDGYLRSSDGSAFGTVFTPLPGQQFDPSRLLYADMSGITSATVNQIRLAFQTQKILERDARGGTRYVEVLETRWNIAPQDARLNRPELWGHGRTHTAIHSVPQTSETSKTTTGTTEIVSPQGNLAANGIVSHTFHKVHGYAPEHGIVMSFVCLNADLTYQDGLHRMFSRKDRYDFAMPEFFHIGEQAILNSEIYAQGVSTQAKADADAAVFGYQERYAEYRYKPSIVSGKFRSNAAGTLHTWHLAQDFANLPTLSSTFMEENPPLDRCLALPDEPHVIFDSVTMLSHRRPLPAFGIPGLIDHF